MTWNALIRILSHCAYVFAEQDPIADPLRDGNANMILQTFIAKDLSQQPFRPDIPSSNYINSSDIHPIPPTVHFTPPTTTKRTNNLLASQPAHPSQAQIKVCWKLLYHCKLKLKLCQKHFGSQFCGLMFQNCKIGVFEKEKLNSSHMGWLFCQKMSWDKPLANCGDCRKPEFYRTRPSHTFRLQQQYI